MKKILFVSLLFLTVLSLSVGDAAESVKHYDSDGEVLSVDPLYGRIVIHHSMIKGFAGEGDTEFFIPTDLARTVQKGDLVHFTVVDKRGDVRIEKIKKTGTAPPKPPKTLGRMVQDVVVSAGEVVKGVTYPVEPAHEVASGVATATSEATGNVLKDAGPALEQDF